MLKKFIFGFLNFIFRFSVAALVVVLVYRLAMYSYHFGYMVFSDASKEPTPGRDIVLTVENTDNVLELGRILMARGVIDDEKIFFVQERLSDFHGKLVPGTYTFNTSMAPSAIFAMMGEAYVDAEEGEDEEETEGDLPDYLKSGYGQDHEAGFDADVGDQSENAEGEMQENATEGEGGEDAEGGSDETPQSEESPFSAGAGL